MANIHNVANPVEEKVQVKRDQIEHRATWMGLTYQTMRDKGVDGEAITREAIKQCGLIHGGNMRAKCDDPENAESFSRVFLVDTTVKTFGMADAKADAGHFSVEFHYCPLVNAWQKLGYDDETCAKLCDIAMDGDRGIAEAMGMELKLSETIAKGDAVCKLKFTK